MCGHGMYRFLKGSSMPSSSKHASSAAMAWPICVGLLCILVAAAWAVATHGLGTASPAMRTALAGSCMAAAATALGTLPVLLAQSFSQRSYDGFLGFGAGVMLGATSFSLVMPAIHAARASGAGSLAASATVGAGIAGGALFVVFLGRLVHTHVQAGLPDAQASAANGYRRVWLFIAAITLHNLPEGLAIGVASAGAEFERAQSLAAGIAIQDVPEGLVVALALRSVGHGRWFSAALGVLSGLVEPVAAVAGVGLISVSLGLLPLGLAAAAGAMLYVIVQEVIPESHSHGHGQVASMALVAGFILMTVLDTAL
jgi:ZIP family zinc transporter